MLEVWTNDGLYFTGTARQVVDGMRRSCWSPASTAAKFKETVSRAVALLVEGRTVDTGAADRFLLDLANGGYIRVQTRSDGDRRPLRGGA